MVGIAEHIRQLALAVGFDDCGFAKACKLEEDALFMQQWVENGMHGEMDYFERNQALRCDPTLLVPGAKTVMVCLLSYKKCGRDYHRKMKSMLYELEKLLQEKLGDDIVNVDKQHIFCDSAPFLERSWAVHAGLGFIGKNHQLIHPTLGSMVHIGELVLSIEVDYSRPIIPSQCGECSLCIAHCPNQALGQTQWDARKCIAYVTHKCVVCQQVCPCNREIEDK